MRYYLYIGVIEFTVHGGISFEGNNAMNTKSIILAALGAAFLFSTAPAVAEEAPGTIYLRLRALEIVPDVSSHVGSATGQVNITDTTIPEADITYFFSEHWAVEAIAGTDKHSIYTKSGTYLGSTYLLPPVVALQYHFDKIGAFKPYLGAGPNYTFFYNKSANGALGKLHLTDGFGFALQAGTDISLGDRFFLNIDVKKVFLQTTASFGASNTVTAHVNINPWLLGVGVGVKF
jgi:outer membrane protein